KGMRTTFSVTGIYSDSSTKDLTGLAQWQIKSPTIAETSTEEAGAFKGLETGSTQIRASYLGLETSASLTVSSATLSSLEIRPKFSDEKSFIHGTSLALQAIGHFSDSTSRDLSTQVSWNESEPSVEISDNGLLSTLGASPDSDVSFLVNASHPDLSSSSALQIKLIPDSITDLQLLGSYDDIHLHGERSVQVYANYSSGRAVNVSSETSIENSAPNTLDVKLDSSNSVLLIGKSSGDALLSFTFLEKKLEETITVNSSTLSQLVIESGGTTLDMVLGERRSLKAAAYFTDGKIEDVSKSVLWTSSDERLLHVSNNEIHRGELSALGLGNARVSSSLNGLSTELDVKVNPLDVNRLEVSPVQKHLLQGSKSPFKATAIISGYSPFDVSALPELTWTSNNSDVANVSNLEENKGLVSSNLNTSGDLVISVEYAGVTASSSLQVHSADELASIRIESSPSVIHLGQRHTYKAFGYFNDGSRTEISDLVRWISKETKIMESVPGSAPGTFRAKTTGTTTIHALYKNFSAQFPVDVLNGSLSQITVTPEADSFIVSTAHQLKAYAHYFSSELNINYKVDITDQARWSTTTPLVGTFPKPLSSPGLTYTLAPGSLEVEASFGTQTAVQTYTVVENFSSLEIESTLTTLEYSLPQQFKAYAVRADGSRIDVTHAAEWWTSVPDIVHIDNTFNSAGLATAIQKKTGGSAVINARFHSINASKEVSLSYDALRPISIAMNSDVDTVLSDGIDKANIAIKVFALGPQSVINDGTGIKVH
ncbi:MAG: hypothetical protein OEX00_09615, partial [Gammaproteobacteria bacterium]|nr:hypothetical protein [Gammaproteobacteria bacterium]